MAFGGPTEVDLTPRARGSDGDDGAVAVGFAARWEAPELRASDSDASKATRSCTGRRSASCSGGAFAQLVESLSVRFARAGLDLIWHVAAADLLQRWGVYPTEGGVFETGISTVLGVTQFACSAEKRLCLMSVLPRSELEERPGLTAQSEG